jgi:Lon protease-like protein
MMGLAMLPWDAEELTFDATQFSGVARLFPLPDLVMFPHVMQPLHIFESRYREMLNAALDSDGLIAMSILAPGWEADYEGRPALLPQICLGKVVTHQRLPDGRYNIMLLGSRRGRILSETPADRSFRQAEIEIVDDVYPATGDAVRDNLQMELTARFQKALPTPQGAKTHGSMYDLLASELPLGVLTDLVSFALPLDQRLKCELLAESDVDCRARLLLRALAAPRKEDASSTAGTIAFPPRFSRN